MKNNIKGIILAGGKGSRLAPMTKGVSKQLLPVYDKPMIYYPLSVLMEVGIKDILIISTKKHLPRFKDMFGDGNKIGVKISYKIQKEPNGIAEAFILGSDFIGNSDVCLILGDNIFYGNGINKFFNKAVENLKENYSTIISVQVKKPNDFGVIDFAEDDEIKKITEKPTSYISNYIVSGIYFYTNNVIEISKKLTPSSRGELEITDINNTYLSKRKLKCLKLPINFIWSDTGTYNSLYEMSKFIKNFEDKTGIKIGCVEEIAIQNNFITKKKFIKLAKSMKESDYGKYLLSKSKNY